MRKIITAAAMLMLMLFLSQAAYAAPPRELWVDGVDLVQGGAVTGKSVPGATYDAATNTLTLENATITETDTNGYSILAFGGGLNIVLKGKNTIRSESYTLDCRGIVAYGNLNITAEGGSLDITVGSPDKGADYYYGINATDITITDATINIDLAGKEKEGGSIYRGILNTGGNVEITNSTINITQSAKAQDSIVSGLVIVSQTGVPKFIIGKGCSINISLDGKYGGAIDIGSNNKGITSEEIIRAVELENGYGFYDGATRLSFKGYSSSGIPRAALSAENSIKFAIFTFYGNGFEFPTNGAMRAVYMRHPVKAPPPQYNANENNGSAESKEQAEQSPAPTDRVSYPIISVSRKNGGATVTVSPTRKGATFVQTYNASSATISVTLARKGRDPEKFAVYRDGVKVEGAYYKDGRMHFPIDAFGTYEIVYEGE